MWGCRRHRGENDGAMGCVVILLLAIFAMPIVGIYMVAKGDEAQKAIGIVLTIIGIIIWIYLGVQ